MSQIWQDGPQSMAQRFVLLAIADYANDDGEAWPSIAGIMKKTTLSERGVQTNIRRLESAGWLQIETGKGRKGCNNYTIKTPQEMHPAGDAPPHIEAETPHMSAETPAPYAPEPSRTIIEPSYIASGEATGADKPAPKPKKQSRKTQLPEDWIPSQKNESDAQGAGLSFDDIDREAISFRDHHRSRGNTMLDWDAAWRTWCRNSIKFTARRGGASQGQESDLQRISRMANEALREGKLQ
jgi:hypothetical protein